ncbi:MAG: hypothetical protein KC481_22290, partial [Acidimicrobiaceae bacterium]|nr:hypothetical protein [Acidimicrobiaceae bacterium]
NLQGAADNEDTFIFAAAGGLSGVVDGGERGFDTVQVNASFNDATFTYTGPTSGSINLDGILLAYTGMEPITVTTVGGPPPTSVTIDIPGASGDHFTLKDDVAAGNGMLLLDSTNATFEDTTFQTPTGTLTINSGNGADEITIEDLGADAPGALIVDGGADSDTIIVTRDAANIDLGDTALAADAETISLLSIEIANITGGASANAFTVSEWSGTGTLTGAGGNDSIALGKDAANITLTDSSLSATGGPGLTLNGIGEATLTGGTGVNAFLVSDWNGIATLAGLGDVDTYSFGNDWGTVTISDDGGMLDFSSVTRTLTVNESGANMVVVAGDGSQVTYDAAGNYGTDLAVLTQAAALNEGLAELAKLGLELKTFDRLGEPLTLLGEQSIGDFLDIGAILDQALAQALATWLGGPDRDLGGLVQLLNALDGSAYTGPGNLNFSVATTGKVSGDVLTLDLSLTATVTHTGVALDLGDEILSLGGTLDQRLEASVITATLVTGFLWDFSVGVDASAIPFFFADFASDMAVTTHINVDPASLVVDPVSFDLTAGLLGLDVGAFGPGLAPSTITMVAA